jgi:cytidylate kinase
LMERDRIDSTRADSPLRQADDAIVIDNTLLNRQEQLELALQLAKEIMKQPA